MQSQLATPETPFSKPALLATLLDRQGNSNIQRQNFVMLPTRLH